MRLVHVVSDYIRRSILTTKGDLVVRGDSQPESLAAGDADTYLRGRGAGEIPIYALEPTITAMRVTLGADQSVPHAIFTKVNFDTVWFDTTTRFDAVNHRYVCNETGFYLTCNNIRFMNIDAGKNVSMEVRVNGVRTGSSMNLAVAHNCNPIVCGSDILSLLADDYVEVFGYHSQGANRNFGGGLLYRTYFAIHRLS